MDIVWKRLDEITPYENNPRDNDQAVDAVASSIKEFGFKVPIVIDAQGVIVAGHTRHKAAKKLGLDPAIMAAPLITTILDTCTILVYFNIVTAFYPSL